MGTIAPSTSLFHLPEALMTQENATSRRDFLRTSALAGGVMAANMAMLSNVHAQNNENPIRVGLIGCGGRGKGAAEECLRGGRNVRLVAMGDAFRDRAEEARARLRRTEAIADNVQVTDDN